MTILVWRYNLLLEYRQLNIYSLQNVETVYLYNMGNQIITFSKYLSKASSSGNHSGYPTSLTIASALTFAKSYKENILCRLFQLFQFRYHYFRMYIYRLFTQEITWVARFIHLDSINNSLKAFLMSSTIDPAWNGMKASMWQIFPS